MLIKMILEHQKSDNDPTLYKWGEINDIVKDKGLTLEYDDILDIERDENYENYNITIYRSQLETDEEFEARRSIKNTYEEWGKKQRYEEYIKLKKEFENE